MCSSDVCNNRNIRSAALVIREISPNLFIPISNTAARCPLPSLSTERGNPTRLFRLPSVFSVGINSERTAAHISLVVVLPLLPVIAVIRVENLFCTRVLCRARPEGCHPHKAFRVTLSEPTTQPQLQLL